MYCVLSERSTDLGYLFDCRCPRLMLGHCRIGTFFFLFFGSSFSSLPYSQKHTHNRKGIERLTSKTIGKGFSFFHSVFCQDSQSGVKVVVITFPRSGHFCNKGGSSFAQCEDTAQFVCHWLFSFTKLKTVSKERLREVEKLV